MIVNLTQKQAIFIQTQLSKGYSLQAVSFRDKRQKQSKKGEEVQIILEAESSQLNRLTNTSSFIRLNKISDHSMSLEDELYAKSPNVLTEEQRRCFVVYHKLRRHYQFHEFHEKFRQKSEPPIFSFEDVERRIIEGAVNYTSYAFWQDIRNLFKQSFTLFGDDSQMSIRITQLEIYFNEIFKYVHNSQRSIVGKLGKVQVKRRKGSKMLNDPPLMSLEEIKQLELRLLSMKTDHLEELWQILSKWKQNEVESDITFEIATLPSHIQREIEALVDRHSRKKIKQSDTVSHSELQQSDFKEQPYLIHNISSELSQSLE